MNHQTAPILLVGLLDESVDIEGSWQKLTAARCLPMEACAALVGQFDGAEASSRRSSALVADYRRLVTRAHRQTTILPVRFGSIFRSPRAVRAEFDRQIDAWRDRLAHVAGCVEVGLRVQAPEPDSTDSRQPVRASSGADYLRRRARQRAARPTARVPAVLARQARPLVRQMNASYTSQPVDPFDGPSFCYNFLVPREHLDSLQTKLSGWRSPRTGASGSLSGPWPPFSFASHSTQSASETED